MVVRCHAGRVYESSAIILLKVTKHSFAGGQRYLEWQRACFKLDKQIWREKSYGAQKTISQNLLIKILKYLAEFLLLSYFE